MRQPLTRWETFFGHIAAGPDDRDATGPPSARRSARDWPAIGQTIGQTIGPRPACDLPHVYPRE
jgi:hypothetical protein